MTDRRVTDRRVADRRVTDRRVTDGLGAVAGRVHRADLPDRSSSGPGGDLVRDSGSDPDREKPGSPTRGGEPGAARVRPCDRATGAQRPSEVPSRFTPETAVR
ncbi:hypothetical protein GCM10010389_20360 [Streptomyces echinoruber]|uniref:Uncharacterized protein n=1 Tax=Streptomyces echinoruber TaxID=68898 RepID=A0A918R222_9ACTN|nr:hypothetical protein GCM10010389_20360 [Streptomyces echinoruber]